MNLDIHYCIDTVNFIENNLQNIIKMSIIPNYWNIWEDEFNVRKNNR